MGALLYVFAKGDLFMGNYLSFILLLPLILWSTFQGILYTHATQVEETLMLAIYEGQKQAALQGYYDDEIYDQMKAYLVNVHNYDPDVIQITGTGNTKTKGRTDRSIHNHSPTGNPCNGSIFVQSL